MSLSSTETLTNSTALSLTPAIHTIVNRFVERRDLLRSLSNAFGSPLNIVFPQLLRENIKSFQDVFSKHQVDGRLYFAHKATRSSSLVSQLAVEDVNLDVSSLNELKHALTCGFRSSRLEASGPKNVQFIALTLLQNVPINVDSLDELKQIVSIHKVINPSKPAPVLLRFSGFQTPHSRFLSKPSRFGIPFKRAGEVFDYLSNVRRQISLLGFSFHLDTMNVAERSIALESCLLLFEDALARGFDPRVINIGGGYKINYLAAEHEWNTYTSALKQSILGKREPLTWPGYSFGLTVEKDTLRGNFNGSYVGDIAGARFLDQLLSHELANLGGKQVASIVRDNMIQLWAEPGQALLDQAGVTIARVNSIRESSSGEPMVCLDLKRQDLSFLDQELFVDPIICYSEQIPNTGDQVGVFFAGNLCVESDLIYRHKKFVKRYPGPSDLVVFPNTAAYCMDFSASNSIMQPVGRKVAVVEEGKDFHWFLDEQYFPFWNVLERENRQ